MTFVLKNIALTVWLLIIAVNLFINFICGYNTDNMIGYVISAAGASVTIPLTIGILFVQNKHLRKKIDELEEKYKLE